MTDERTDVLEPRPGNRHTTGACGITEAHSDEDHETSPTTRFGIMSQEAIEERAADQPDELAALEAIYGLKRLTVDRPTKLNAVAAVSLMRTPRQRCQSCKRRRVLYYLRLDQYEEPGITVTLKLCAECSGIR